MKTKLFFLILLFIIPFGCKEEKKKVNYSKD